MRALIVLCAVGIFSVPARSQEHYDTRGFGTTSCSEFAQFYRSNPDLTERQYTDWTLGFISGVNSRSSDHYYDLNGKTLVQMFSFLRRYCDENPLKDFRQGAVQFMFSLPTVIREKNR
jgi:hypothetical protein